MTDNEWSVKQLTRLGVSSDKIEFITIIPGLFGTFSEAKTLKKIAGERGIQNLLLVCSAYHSQRVWVTFSALLQQKGVKIEIHGADESVGLRGLLVEYGKLLVYKYLLIPFHKWFGQCSGLMVGVQDCAHCCVRRCSNKGILTGIDWVGAC